MGNLTNFRDDPVDLGTGAANILTVAAGKTLTIQNIHVHNRNAAAKKVSISISATSATELLSGALLDDVSIPANDFIEFGAGMKIGNAAARYLVGLAESASSISVKVSGTLDDEA